MLHFEKFGKHYNGRRIISADLELPHNAYWLRGRNGTGKTTLLKSIAGLIPFDGGISVHGKEIRNEPMAYRRSVNYAEAEPLYPPFLTGRELMAFYAAAKGGNRQQLDEVAERLGADGYLQDKTGTYSSGMTKKLSLVLAFCGQPRLILLDEPLITLDQQSVTVLQQLILDHYRKGTSILITSHQELPVTGLQLMPLTIEDQTLKLATQQ